MSIPPRAHSTWKAFPRRGEVFSIAAQLEPHHGLPRLRVELPDGRELLDTFLCVREGRGMCAGCVCRGYCQQVQLGLLLFFFQEGTTECPKMAIAWLSGESLMTPWIGEQSKAFAKMYFLDEPLPD